MRLINKKSSAVLFLIVIVSVSCRPREVNIASPGINEVEAGKMFRVTLPEEHTSGYTWQFKSEGLNQSVVEELNAVWHGPVKGIDFNFKALAAGQTTLTFVKRKYTDTLTVNSFIVKITD